MQTFVVHYVDDLPSNLKSIALALKEAQIKDVSFKLETFRSDEEYFAKSTTGDAPDIVLLDVAIGEKRDAGLEMAQFVRKTYSKTTIVMYSQFDDADTVLRYLGAGADEFVSKDTELAQIPSLLLECHQRISEKHRLSIDSHDALELREITIVGRTMKAIAEGLRRVVQTQLRSVFIFGETGTGKEIVAKTLHSLLPPQIPFVSVNCGALSPSLLESQLFGHVKGSFTGANINQEGLFEAASGGWLFLDEVAELTQAAQIALLRVLESQEIIRIGENSSRKVNVKILSATNQDLQAKVAEGTFRRDLIERLVAHQITLPPLRERKEEIESLAAHFLQQIVTKKYSLSGTTLELLKRYDWPTNIRELRNVILDMAAFSNGDLILPSVLPKKIIARLSGGSEAENTYTKIHREKGPGSGAFESIMPSFTDAKPTLAMLEDELLLKYSSYLLDTLEINSLRSLARELGIAHATLIRRIKSIEKNKRKIPYNLKLLWGKQHER